MRGLASLSKDLISNSFSSIATQTVHVNQILSTKIKTLGASGIVTTSSSNRYKVFSETWGFL